MRHRLPRELWRVVQCRLASTSTSSEHRDIVIVGGGVAGLALAAAFCELGFLGPLSDFGLNDAAAASKKINSTCSIALVEGSDLSKVAAWSPASTRYENRVSSITADSRRLLERIGAWQHVDVSRTKGLMSMQVWDGLSKARIRFDVDDVPQEIDAMAWLTENANLSRALMRTLECRTNVELISGARVEEIEQTEHGLPLLKLNSGKRLRPRLLVGADGFNSPVRKFAGVDTTGWAYDTHAVVATLDIEPTLANTTAFQRFLPSGPIAYLPLSDTAASLVWSTRPAVAAVLKQLDGQTLAEVVHGAFRLPWHSVEHIYRLLLEGSAPQLVSDELNLRSSRTFLNPDDVPSADMVPPRVTGVQGGTQAAFPLRYAHADAYVTKDRVALLGDAAHTVHPLAGQGLNLGLGDVGALSRAVEEAIEQGADIGSLTSLQPYARARYLQNHAMMSAIDKLHKLYGSSSFPVVWARSAGLEVLNELGIIKAAIMGQAGAVGENGGETTSQSIWRVAAAGLEAAQTALPIVQRIGLGLTETVSSRLRR